MKLGHELIEWHNEDNALAGTAERRERDVAFEFENVMAVSNERCARECLGRRQPLALPKVLYDPAKAPRVDPCLT